MPEFFRREQADQISIIAGMLSDYYSEGKDEESIKNNISKLARLSRTQIVLIDANGNVKYQSEMGAPEFIRNQIKDEIKLQPDEIEKVKNGEAFSRVKDIDNTKIKIAYSAYPVYYHENPAGALMSIMYMGEPDKVGFTLEGLFMNKPPAGGPPPHGKPPADGPPHGKPPGKMPFPGGPPGFLRDFNSILLRSIFLAFLIASITAFAIARSFIKPVVSIEQAIRNIEKGDFSHQIDLSRNDELGALSRSFNDMSLKLKKIIQERIQFIGDISHELMTPLASIQGCTEALIDGVVSDEEKRKKYLGVILDQAKRLSLLKNDLIELSRFEYGKTRITFRPFPVKLPVSKAIESAHFMAENKDIDVVSVIGDKDLHALGDPDRILQVIQNLLNNAIHHNPPKTRVMISVKKDVLDKTKVLFSIEDNGKGIPPEDLENIFERFYKVDRSREKGESFTGLGLAIAREIVIAHNSDISVSSSNNGTKFWFSLPVASDMHDLS